MSKVLYYKIQIDGVKDENVAIGQLDIAVKRLTNILKELNEQETKNEHRIGRINVALANAKKQRSELITEIKKTTVATVAEEGSMVQMEIALQKANLAYRQLSKARREGAEGAAMLLSIKRQTEELSKLEQATGRFQRQVGNYNTAGVAMSQVLREIPAFTFSAQTGILALSNNIPILVDEMKRISLAIDNVTGKKKGWAGAFKEMASNLFSLGGAMTIALGLFTIFSDEIFKFIKGTEKASESTKELKTEQEALNDAVRNFYNLQNFGKDALGNATTDFKILSEVLTILKTDIDDTTVSTAELNSALAASREQLANLKLEGTNIAGFGEMITDEDRARFNATRARLLANIDLLQKAIDERTAKNAKKSAKDKKAVELKEAYDFQSEINEAEIALIKDKYIQELAMEEERFRQQMAMYERQKTEYPAQVKEINDLIEIAQIQHNTNIAKINDEANKEMLQRQSDERKARLDGVESTLEWYEQVKSEQKKHNDELDKEQKQSDAKRLQNIREIHQFLTDATNQYFKMQEDAIRRHLKNQEAILEKDAERQNDILKNRLDKGLITEAQYNADKAELDRKTQELKIAEQKKAFEEEKKLAKAKIAIATAVAIIETYMASGGNYYVATVKALGITAISLAQMAAVDAQEFAEGGLVLDRDKNIPTKANGDSVLTTLTPGEIVLNKQQQAMLGGNKTFAAIGVPNVPNVYPSAASGGSQSTMTKKDFQIMFNSLGRQINSKKVISVESESRRIRNNVENYESQAKW